MFNRNNELQNSERCIKNNVPITCVPSIQWPAITEPRAAQALALQFQLHQSQWWKPDKLLRWQLKQLGEIVQHAYKNSPFYQMHYKSTRVKKSLTQDVFKSLPLVTKNNIQQSATGLLSNNIPAEHGKVTEVTTSGSTGKPVDICKTELMGFVGQAFTLRDHDWHNRDLSAVFSTIRHSPEQHFQAPDGHHQSGWGASCQGIYNSGESIRLDSACSSNEQLTWLLENAPDYLMTYPSNLSALIECSLQRNETPLSIKEVITMGELLPNKLRQRLSEKWQIKLTDVYSCQEAGTLALQCPHNDHYHVQCENVLLEVINDYDKPCQPGETGRVVISSLHNYASPLIRYEVGDFAEVGSPCDCGRGLPVLNRIYGRARNMLTYPDGNTSWPYMGGAGYYKNIAPIEQFQVIQIALNKLEFHLVVENSLTKQQENTLINRLHETLRYPFIIEFHYHEEIKRSAGGKYEDFISRIL